MARQSERERLEEARAAWLSDYQLPRDLPCPACGDVLGTLFYITWAEQPLMDAVADDACGGVPTQGFFLLVPQTAGVLQSLPGRRRYGRSAPPDQPVPPAWVGLPGEVTCAACRVLAQVPHPRFPEQDRLDALLRADGQGRRRWRRG